MGSGWRNRYAAYMTRQQRVASVGTVSFASANYPTARQTRVVSCGRCSGVPEFPLSSAASADAGIARA